MRSDWKITCYKPERQGVFSFPGGVKFAATFSSKEECGILLYGPKGKEVRIPFSPEGQRGNLYGIIIEGIDTAKWSYNYYEGAKVFTDPYAKRVFGLEKWGNPKRQRIAGALTDQPFDWEKEEDSQRPFEDVVLYGLNVRGFTMHKSSGVKKRGTFEGLMEKIPYLKELGINTVELMPCYEYEECMERMPGVVQPEKEAQRYNLWGFQNGYYFAPKSSFSAINNPQLSMKNMVKALHKNGIEIILHFYFPDSVRQMFILEVIRYWILEYHIDGVRLSGAHIPVRLLAEDPCLGKAKIWCDHLLEIDMDVIENAGEKHFAEDHPGFQMVFRRFLKGDEGMIGEFLNMQRRNPASYALINYVADYQGFSLYDSVCYERKHNEENGEGNRDGAEINHTWNCGVEGESRKKAIVELRKKQLKNMLTFLFLSQGTPFLFSGDEMGNTRYGNNNCYCQDNEVGWVKWKENAVAKELFSYTRFMISLRKQYRIFHMKEELKVLDTKGIGYPDISYHGTEAWRPDMSYLSHMAGIMLHGAYAGEEPSFYLAYNMHWETHELALPKLPKGFCWKLLAQTDPVLEAEKTDEEKTEAGAVLAPRSAAIYLSAPSERNKTGNEKRK